MYKTKSYFSKKNVTHILVLFFIFLSLSIASISFAAIGINKQIPFYGTLKTSGNVNVANGNYNIIFKIYDASSSGNVLWTGRYTTANSNAVTVSNGVFNVLLGSGTGNTMNLDFNNNSYYLGITVGSDSEMTPRQRLGSVGSAINSNTVNGIGFSTSTLSVGDLLYADSTKTLQRIGVGSNGQVLKLASGVPSWGADLQGTSQANIWATTTNSLLTHPVDVSDVVTIGTNATTTTGNILEVKGNSLFKGSGLFTNITGYTASVGALTATSSLAVNGNTTLATTTISGNNTLTVGTGLTSLGGSATVAGTLNVTGTTTLGNLSMNSTRITSLAAPVGVNDATNKAYVDAVAQGMTWQPPVIALATTTAPATPSTGDRYIVLSGASSFGSCTLNQIAQWSGTAWACTTPSSGWSVYVNQVATNYNFNNTKWVSLGSTINHVNLFGLQGGQTGQYYHLNKTNYDEVTSPKAQLSKLLTTGAPSFVGLTLTGSSTRADSLNVVGKTTITGNASVSATTTTQGLSATFANLVTSTITNLTSSIAKITNATIATLTGTNATLYTASVGALTATSSLAVTGNTTLATTTISGNTTLTNASSTNQTVSGYLNVAGNTTLANASTTQLTVSGPAYFNASTTFNGVGYLFPLADGTANQVLQTNSKGGLSWGTISSSGGGSWATTTDNLIIYPTNTSYVTVLGTNATTTTGNILEVKGNSLFKGSGLFTNITGYTASVGALTATSSLAVTGNTTLATTTLNNLLTANKGIALASSTPLSTINALYNKGGALYFGSSELGLANTSNGTLVGSSLLWNGAKWTENKLLSFATSSNILNIQGTASSTNLAVANNSTIKGTLSVTGNTTLATTTLNNLLTANKGIALASSTPLSTINALYNKGGALYFGSSELGLANTSNGTLVGSSLLWNGAKWTENKLLSFATSSNILNIQGTASSTNLAVANNSTIKGTLSVTGNTTLATTTISGKTTLGNASTTQLTVSGPAYFNGTTTLNGVSANGSIIPSSNATYNLGDATHQWKSLYISSTTIYVAGIPLSNSSGALTWGGSSLNVGGFSVSGNSATSTGKMSASSLSISGNSSLAGLSFTNATGTTLSLSNSLTVSGNTILATTTLNNLLTVNKGIALASSTPLSTTNALYNTAGLLYWNGTAVGTGSSTFAYITATSTTKASTFAGAVGIGTTTPTQKLSVAGFINTDRYSGYKQAGNTVLYASSTNSSTLAGIGAGSALRSDGFNNTAVGYQALNVATSTDGNTAVGYQAGFSNTTGSNNSFIGTQAGNINTTGSNNSFVGLQAGYLNTTGSYNSFLGTFSGVFNSTGSSNSFIGYNAGRYISDGVTANATGSNNTFLGYGTRALADGDANETVIGYNSTGIGSNSVVLGNDSVITTALKGNVGIGTTTPSGKLDVAGPSIYFGTGSVDSNVTLRGYNSAIANITTNAGYNSTYNGIGITSNPSNNNSLPAWGVDIGGNLNAGSTLSDVFAINRKPSAGNWANLLTIDSSGRVGIGTTTPAWNLVVAGTDTKAVVSGSVGAAIYLQKTGVTPVWSEWQQTGDRTRLNTINLGADVFTILNTGNVGIGVANPTLGPLQLASGAYVTTGGVWTNASSRDLKTNFTPLNSKLILSKIASIPITRWNYKTESATTTHIGPVAQDFYKAFGVGGATGSTTISTIDPSGVALLGIQALDTRTKFISSATTSEALYVNALGNVGIGTSTPSSRLTIWGPDTSSTTAAFTIANSASTTEFQVNDNGDAFLAGSLSQNSDRRLKTKIEPLSATSSLAKITGLTPVYFNWKDSSKSSVTQLGFIAQDVQQIFPNIVSTTSATALTPGGTLSLNYIGLISPIVASIKDLAIQVSNFAKSITTEVITATTGRFTNLSSKNISTEKLCIGNTCVSEAELKALLKKNNQTATVSVAQTGGASDVVNSKGSNSGEGVGNNAVSSGSSANASTTATITTQTKVITLPITQTNLIATSTRVSSPPKAKNKNEPKDAKKSNIKKSATKEKSVVEDKKMIKNGDKIPIDTKTNKITKTSIIIDKTNKKNIASTTITSVDKKNSSKSTDSQILKKEDSKKVTKPKITEASSSKTKTDIAKSKPKTVKINTTKPSAVSVNVDLSSTS